MCIHETSCCPRCGSEMTCKVGNITQCDCFSVNISDETRYYLTKTDYGCVCNRCLMELNRKMGEVSQYPFPTRKEQFVEGLHFYAMLTDGFSPKLIIWLVATVAAIIAGIVLTVFV